MNDDRYLWDRSGATDAPDRREIEELERLLGRYGHRTARPSATASTHAPRRAALLRWSAGLAACALIALTLWFWRRTSENDTTQNGSTMRLIVDGGTALADDTWFVATPEQRVLTLGTVGLLDLEPGSRLRVQRVGNDAASLYLASGTLTAKVDPGVPARFFAVATPQVECVDLGCAYQLTVDPADGRTRVRVTDGQVAFERGGKSVYIPRGAVCTAIAARIGTPYFENSRPAIGKLVEGYDTAMDPGRREDYVHKLCATTSTGRDTLPLWHLLMSDQSAVVEAAEAELVRIAGHPRGATKAAPAVDLDEWREHLFDLWWE